MKVLYTGNYRETAVNYHGAVFVCGRATEVTEEWFGLHGGAKIVAEVQPPVDDRPPVRDVEEPKRRGRPKKVINDNND